MSVEYFREPNGDYLCIERSAVPGRVTGIHIHDGRACAIAGQIASVCTTGISESYIADCKSVDAGDVPTKWTTAFGLE